jgi:hypothetical protein
MQVRQAAEHVERSVVLPVGAYVLCIHFSGRGHVERKGWNLLQRKQQFTEALMQDQGHRVEQKWRLWIANFFRDRVTNGVTKGINNKIKLLKRMAYGLPNFAHLRARILLAFALKRSARDSYSELLAKTT